jgi:hypothetical protein
MYRRERESPLVLRQMEMSSKSTTRKSRFSLAAFITSGKVSEIEQTGPESYFFFFFNVLLSEELFVNTSICRITILNCKCPF